MTFRWSTARYVSYADLILISLMVTALNVPGACRGEGQKSSRLRHCPRRHGTESVVDIHFAQTARTLTLPKLLRSSWSPLTSATRVLPNRLVR
jgi:hypothetical protein